MKCHYFSTLHSKETIKDCVWKCACICLFVHSSESPFILHLASLLIDGFHIMFHYSIMLLVFMKEIYVSFSYSLYFISVPEDHLTFLQ